MADVPFADVFRPVRCNQTVIASDARSSIWRVIVGRDNEHDTSLFGPRLFLGPLPEQRKLSITRDRGGEEQFLSHVISQSGLIVIIQHWATPLTRCCRRGLYR